VVRLRGEQDVAGELPSSGCRGHRVQGRQPSADFHVQRALAEVKGEQQAGAEEVVQGFQ
jgi:hypothetical protein